MNIYGITDGYSIYDKIPITEAQWFDEYEYNIEDLYSGITMNLRVCKSLRKGSDILWLQEYLKMITQYIARQTNNGTVPEEETIFDSYKLICIHHRFVCKYGIDIFEGIQGLLRDMISRLDECYNPIICDAVLYGEAITIEDIDYIKIYSDTVYDFEGYIPYVKLTETHLQEITDYYTEDGYLYIKNTNTWENADIIVKNVNCFYIVNTPTPICNSTATGVYNANGDYVLTITPAVEETDIILTLDGEAKAIDGVNIIYANGVLTIKNAYMYNRISVTGCPVISGVIGSSCLYTFTNNSDDDDVKIVVSGGTLPTETDIVIKKDNAVFPTASWTYDAQTGEISFPIEEAYLSSSFSITIGKCVFNFSFDEDSSTIVVNNPAVITDYELTKCSGCDLLTIEISYVLDPEAEVPNTYIPVETILSTIVDGCKETYTKIDYYCADNKKYSSTVTYTKCFGDASWTASEPVIEEMADPGECALPTPPEGEIYDECNGADLYTHTITYVYNETTHAYDETDTVTLKTANGCKETYSIIENICVNGIANIRTTVYTKNFGDAQWVAGTPTVETGGTADCLEEISGLERCDGCDKEVYTKTIKYDTDTHAYTITETITNTDANGCQESYTISKYVCDGAGNAQRYDKTCTRCNGVGTYPAWTCGSWVAIGTPYTEEKCGDGSAGLLVDPEP